MVAPGQRIAVIGGGISGNIAAYILSRAHEVTIFERNDYLGGHTNTRVIRSGSDQGLAVDTGFIVCNQRNYPHFYKFLGQLEVALQNSEMSFGFSSELDGLRYLGPSLKEFMRLPQTFLKPKLIKLFFEQRAFGKRVLKDLNQGKLEEVKLSGYLDQLGVSATFRDLYLYPLIGAIWSSADSLASEFPAATFAAFFRNHGMLDLSQRPQWQTVKGGSHAYVKKFQEKFSGKIVLNAPVAAISRDPLGVNMSVCGSTERFDHVVLATHANEALKLLSDPSDTEREILSAWQYSMNDTVLHTDRRIVPGTSRTWASWNYLKRNDRSLEGAVHGLSRHEVQISYYMNRLQNLRAHQDYLVTLNRSDEIQAEKILYRVGYSHPIFSPEAVRSQVRLRELNGHNRTFYAGAHLGYGFHEDGVNSGIEVARHFGMQL